MLQAIQSAQCDIGGFAAPKYHIGLGQPLAAAEIKKKLFTRDINQKTFSLHDGLWALPRGLYLVEVQSRSSGQRELRKWLKME